MRQEEIGKIPFNKVVDRRLKVFWVIQRLRCNYFQESKRYSLKDVVVIVNSLLERKGFKKVTKRTIQNDIKNFEKLGLLKTNFNPLGKNNGSFTHYIINETLEKIASKVISKTYFSEKKNRKELAIRKIVKKDQLKEKTQKFKISHQIFSHLLSEKQVKNNISKNSRIEKLKDKEKALEKSILYKFKDLMEEDLVELREIVQSDLSYKNTLWNLKDYMEELIEYAERPALTFFKSKLKEKKNKVWFMSKKSARTDFNLIIGEFKDRNKTKRQNMDLNCIKAQSPRMHYIDNPSDIKRIVELLPVMNLRVFN
ncbi:plasmid maintenance protein [Borrelia sp. P9F1]|uniref:plasmid maintenance protein n=1 Tax=Borrelia sp. P9F1 TaxID=3058374 RepID=UPI0026470EAB|nr:plasmid maintenance protein [Borrelia sp. P9F1]WKC58604.1 plasmid maintenance protein [Borrelia sp. P9F1]